MRKYGLTVSNDRLRRFGVYHAGQMCIQHSTVLVIPSMHLQEVSTEVLHDGIEFVRTVAER